MKFAALNKEASTSTSSLISTPSGRKGRPTLEAQESACRELYHTAIRLQQDGNLLQAKEIYREILESEVMEEVSEVLQNSTLCKLKYLVYKNIAVIAKEQGDLSAAVEAYIEASTIDTSDVTMWCQLASAASLLGNLLLARKAFECAMEVNDSHWPALEGLCAVLFALEDHFACLMVVKKGFDLDLSFPRGLVYLHHISEQCPDLIITQELTPLRLQLMRPCPSGDEFLREAQHLQQRRRALLGVELLPDDVVPNKKITTLTIYNLASCLLSLYKQCKELSKTKLANCFQPSYLSKIDTTSLLDGATEEPVSLPHSSPGRKCQLPGGGSPMQQEAGGACGTAERRDAKRRLLDELEPFAPKRRSTRVKTKVTSAPLLQQGQNHFEMLCKFLPSWLKIDELPEINLLSPLKKHKDESSRLSIELRKNQLSAICDSTPQMNESEVVKEFVASCKENSGILNLLKKFLLFLSLRYDQKWCGATYPVLIMFTDIYECLHSHLTLPSTLSCTLEDTRQPAFKNMAMVALCYLEAYVDCVSSKRSTSGKRGLLVDSLTKSASPTPPKCFSELLIFVSRCAGLVGDSEQERVKFALRYIWCHCKWYLVSSDSAKATGLLHQCERMLEAHSAVLACGEDPVAVCVPNLREDSVISLDHVHEKLRQLEQSVSMSEVLDLYKNSKYSSVVEKLLPLFDDDPDPPLELITGRDKASPEEKTCLSLLLSSLLELHHYDNCLQTAVQATLVLLSHNNPGNEQWGAALKDTFITINSCLPPVEEKPPCLGRLSGDLKQRVDDTKQQEGQNMQESQTNDKECCNEPMDVDTSDLVCSRGDLLKSCDIRLLKRLVVCVVKTMDIVSEVEDMVHYLPIAVPWKVFYSIIASQWEAGAALVSTPVLPVPEDKENTLVEMAHPPEPMHTSSEPSNPLNSPVISPSLCLEPNAPIATSQIPVSMSDQNLICQLPSCYQTDMLTIAHTLTTTSQPSSPTSTNHSQSVTPSTPLREDDLSPTLKFLIEAHDHLGRMGWCCKESGCFLKLSVNVLRCELKQLQKLPTKHRDTLLLELEQCYYCLHGHPHKKAKARGLIEHNSPQVPLSWDSALRLLEYFHPSPLPSIDDVKSPQVTPELVSLYKRITDVLPQEGKGIVVIVISREDLDGLIDGTCIESMVVRLLPHKHTTIIAEVYYLLADDALKTGYNHNAIQLYLQMLCYCPEGFDSWAGLALARTRKIVERLSMRDVKTGMERYVQKQTAPTVRCYEKAVSLNNRHCYIVEKFGFFCYSIQSFTSQIINLPELYLLKDIHTWASDSLGEMLLLSQKCFKQALNLSGSKHCEPWLYQLMLGKIGRKLSQPFERTLSFFIESCESLAKDEAGYPDYVELSAKYHALEAIEGHYQLYTYILKTLLKQSKEKTLDPSIETFLTDNQSRLNSLPLGVVNYPGVRKWVWSLVAMAIEETAGGEKKEQTKGTSSQMEERETSKFDVVLLKSGSCLYGDGDTQVQPPREVMDITEWNRNEETQKVKSEPPRVSIPPGQPHTAVSPTVEGDLSSQNTKERNNEQVPPKPPQETKREDNLVFPVISLKSSLSDFPIDTISEEESSIDKMNIETKSEQATKESCPVFSKKVFGSVDADILTESLYGIAVCSVRCPAYFKSLYRMAAACFEMGLTSQSKELLLGPLPSALLEQQEKLLPLFVLKPNIFSNMWQIPTEEINRPGNFSTHARRNLNLLLEVLLQLCDVSSLSYLAQHLKSKPDSTKQYMRDNERVAMYKKAVRYAVQALQSSMANLSVLSQEELAKFQTIASCLKPLTKVDSSHKLTKEIQKVIELLKAAIVPPSPPTTSQDTVKHGDINSNTQREKTVESGAKYTLSAKKSTQSSNQSDNSDPLKTSKESGAIRLLLMNKEQSGPIMLASQLSANKTTTSEIMSQQASPTHQSGTKSVIVDKRPTISQPSESVVKTSSTELRKDTEKQSPTILKPVSTTGNTLKH